MALNSLYSNKKFLRLIRDLGISKAQTLGHLELLWHSTYSNCDPNVGDFIDIEVAAEWEGECGDFAKALETRGFIDRIGDSDEYEIHQWSEHAPPYIKRKLLRQKPSSVNKCPTLTDNCKPSVNKSEPEVKRIEEKGIEEKQTTDSSDSQSKPKWDESEHDSSVVAIARHWIDTVIKKRYPGSNFELRTQVDAIETLMKRRDFINAGYDIETIREVLKYLKRDDIEEILKENHRSIGSLLKFWEGRGRIQFYEILDKSRGGTDLLSPPVKSVNKIMTTR